MQARERVREIAAAGGSDAGSRAERARDALFSLSADAHLLTEALAGEGGEDALALPTALARVFESAGEGDDAGGRGQHKRRRSAGAGVGAGATGAGAGAAGAGVLPWGSHDRVEAKLSEADVVFHFL
jgi:hypothetical protein